MDMREADRQALRAMFRPGDQEETTETIHTADIVVARDLGDGLEILLIQRRKDPFQGAWALPGGKFDDTKDVAIEDTARREVYEETGVPIDFFTQVGVYDASKRDPRPGRWISTAFVTHIFSHDPDVRAGDDAVAAAWFSLNDLPDLAFDHEQIIEDAKRLYFSHYYEEYHAD